MTTRSRDRIVLAVACALAPGLGHVGTPGVPWTAAPAQAVVGAPLTPLGVAGVARRSAYRGAATSSQQPPAAAAPQEAAPASALPAGTIVGALPSGCTTVNLAGKDFFDCGGTLYSAGFRSGNVVYVVSEP